MANSKLLSSEMDEDEGSMEADTGEVSRNRTLLETGRTMQKGRRLSGRKLEIDDTGDNHFDDIKEACSGTEEGYRLGAVKGKHDKEVAGERVSRASSLGLRKRSKKVLFQRGMAVFSNAFLQKKFLCNHKIFTCSFFYFFMGLIRN